MVLHFYDPTGLDSGSVMDLAGWTLNLYGQLFAAQNVTPLLESSTNFGTGVGTTIGHTLNGDFGTAGTSGLSFGGGLMSESGVLRAGVSGTVLPPGAYTPLQTYVVPMLAFDPGQYQLGAPGSTFFDFEVLGWSSLVAVSMATAQAHFSGTSKPRTTGATPNSKYTHIGPDGKAVQNAIYDADGKVIGHVDFKNHGPGAPSGHGHQFPSPGNPASGHGPGKPHIPPNQLPPGWDDLPPGVSPRTPIGQ